MVVVGPPALATPTGQSGSMTLYRAAPNEHLALAKHLTAEVKREEFIAERGVVTRWERVRRQNHWFDALYNACAAGYFCGARLLGETVKRQTVRRSAIINAGMRQPDGRPWVDVEGWWQMNRFG